MSHWPSLAETVIDPLLPDVRKGLECTVIAGQVGIPVDDKERVAQQRKRCREGSGGAQQNGPVEGSNQLAGRRPPPSPTKLLYHSPRYPTHNHHALDPAVAQQRSW